MLMIIIMIISLMILGIGSFYLPLYIEKISRKHPSARYTEFYVNDEGIIVYYDQGFQPKS